MGRTKKDNAIVIHEAMPKCVAEDLTRMRLFRGDFQLMSRRQFVDLNDKLVRKAIENEPNSDGKMPFDHTKLTVGGYSIEQITEGFEKAQAANDKEAAKVLGKMMKMYYNKLRVIRPVITVKKILGWNAGYIVDKPWFSTCWEDNNGRVMMDVLFSTEKLDDSSNNDIDKICEDNNIYHKLDNFVSIKTYEDRLKYTQYIDLYTEGQGRDFYRSVIVLRESADSPKMCDAEFCSVESLKKFNGTTHIINTETFHRIMEKRRLDNEVLKRIPIENVKLIYYNQSQMSREFAVLVKKKKIGDEEMVTFSKNVIAKRADYVWYTGTYGTSDLLPDNLNAKFSTVLDNDGFRQRHGNEQAMFALDDISGMAIVGEWTTISNQIEHLMIAQDSQEVLMDRLDKRIILPEKMMKSNIESDLKECWLKVIENAYKMDEGSLKPKRAKDLAGIKPDKVIAFAFATSEAKGWTGLAEFVMNKGAGKVSAVTVECAGQRNKENLAQLKKLFPFLDSKEVHDYRAKMNEGLKEDKGWFSSFDMLRGGYDFIIPNADFRWFDMGFGNHLFVNVKYIREVFDVNRVRQMVKEEKLRQMSARSRQELYNLILAQWVRFFDEVV